MMRAALPLLLLALVPPSRAQELELRGPDPGQVMIGEKARFVLVYRGPGRPGRILPPEVEGLDFRIGSPQSFSNTRILQGRMTRDQGITWPIEAVPRKKGLFLIPAFRIKVGLRLLETRQSRLRCVEGLTEDEAGFVEAGASRREIWLFESLDLWVKVGVDESLIGKLRVGDPRRGQIGAFLTAPWLENFPGGLRSEELPPGQDYSLAMVDHWVPARHLGRETRNDREYQTFELRRRFIANRAGRFRLAGPYLSLEYVTRYQRTFFGELEAAATAKARTKGRGQEILVKPLPEEGRPSDFRNAVGDLRISGGLSKRRLKLGEGLTLSFRVEGEGNLEFLDLPEFDDLPGFHRHSKKVERRPGQVLGTYEFSAVDPRVKRFPPVSLAFFHPGRASYDRGGLPSVPVEVIPPENAVELEDLPDASRELTPGIDDIWDRMPLEGALPGPFRPGGLLVGLVLASPLLLLAFWFGWVLPQQRLRQRPGILRRRRAGARFLEGLETDGALRAFSLYLADRFDWREGAAVGGDLPGRLLKEGLSPGLSERCGGLMRELLALRYAGGSREAELASKTRNLVAEIEKGGKA